MRNNMKIPANPEAEAAVVGAVLNDPAILDEIRIDPSAFWDVRARYVLEAARSLADRGQPVTPSSLTESLKAAGKYEKSGGGAFIADLLTAGSGLSPGLIRPDIETIREKAKLRALLELADGIRAQAQAPGADPVEILTVAEAGVFALADTGQGSGGPVSIGEAAAEAFTAIEQRQAQGGALSGCPSGVYALDGLTGGFQPGELVIGPAATTSSGKTALALQFAENAAKSGYPALFFSLEMSRTQLVQRYMSNWADLGGHCLKMGTVDEAGWSRLIDSVGRAHKTPIFIDDSPQLHISEVRSRARAAKRKHGIGLVIVDYLQLVKGDRQRGDTREREVSSISAGLKSMAKELSLPVVGLAQLNRLINQRPARDRKPRLSDLRESGALEQDADIVLLLDRPETHNPTPENRGKAVLILAKHRNGPTGAFPLIWRPERTRFGNPMSGGEHVRAA